MFRRSEKISKVPFENPSLRLAVTTKRASWGMISFFYYLQNNEHSQVGHLVNKESGDEQVNRIDTNITV